MDYLLDNNTTGTLFPSCGCSGTCSGACTGACGGCTGCAGAK